jgi:tryptophan-rich sensory protein
MALYFLQLALNLGWSAIFFGARRIDWALVEIVALFIAILWTGSAFHARDRLSGWLFVPYAAWVAFALLLNASIWLLN